MIEQTCIICETSECVHRTEALAVQTLMIPQIMCPAGLEKITPSNALTTT